MSFMDESLKNSVVAEKSDVKRITLAQFQYKLSMYHHRLLLLILLQIVAIAFSFTGSSFATSFSYYSIHINLLSGNIILTFTFIWVFINGLHLNSKKAEELSYTFVSTKKTHHISNLLYMVFLSIVAGVTGSLVGFIPKTLLYIFSDKGMLLSAETITFGQLLTSVLIAILYSFLLVSIGYFFGSLTKIHPVLIFFLPALIIGLFYINEYMVIDVGTFFIMETDVILLSLKIVGVSLLLFLIATLLDRRLEVG